MPTAPGKIWIEGMARHFVDAAAPEWKYTGILGAASSDSPSLISTEGDDLHVYDASSNERTLPRERGHAEAAKCTLPRP